ncbi:CAAX amino terminal protease self- immunity [Anatilimnocola aggregata]|uniref:CAAX amino terminal protease self-immunity n=1 Tax=Anatilimnocola aggregata TaxID=2528021 RepID=A0A517Y6D0_9BACT|nr:CPBP family intramembrane glutamic endopeptidase [Anatilimnocola aggregata]QDU25785.1 CAAX amino terminal protease self- immunity [Anatilimnocola aggregata]
MSFVSIYYALMLTVFGGGIAIWVWLVPRLLRRETIIPYQPRRLVPWSLVDLLLVFVLLVVCSVIGDALFPSQKPPKSAVSMIATSENGEQAASQTTEVVAPLEQLSLPEGRRRVALDCGIKVVVALLAFAAITFRLRATITDWGLTLQHWREDIKLGAGTFLAIFLPMIGLQVLLVNGLDWKYEHPLIELAKTKDVPFFALAVLSAVVIAPLFEEFIFRGLMQGWLEKVFSGTASAEAILMGGTTETVTAVAADDASTISPKPLPHTSQTNWPSIITSTIIFSALHYSHGPAWIPLLIFGAALGFVYQRTHRLWPGVIAHFMLNGLTMFGLLVQTFFAPATS